MLPLLASTMSFYFSTLEEYYIGGLFLGVGNGVTDGSVLLIFLYLFAGYKGNAVFNEDITIPIGSSSISFRFNYAFGNVIFFSQIIAVTLK